MFNFFSLFILLIVSNLTFLVLAHNIAYTEFKTQRFIYRRKISVEKKWRNLREEKRCVCVFFSFYLSFYFLSLALEYNIVIVYIILNAKWNGTRIVKCVQQESRTDRDGDEDPMKNCMCSISFNTKYSKIKGKSNIIIIMCLVGERASK